MKRRDFVCATGATVSLALLKLPAASFVSQQPPAKLVRDFNEYVGLLGRFDTLATEVRKTRKPSTEQVKQLQSLAETLFKQLENAQRTIAQYEKTPEVTKLSAEEYNKKIESGLREAGANERFLKFVQNELGGFSAAIKYIPTETAKNDLSEYITNTLNEVKPQRMTFQKARFSSTSWSCIRCHCAWYAVASGALLAIGAVPGALGAAAAGLACVSNAR